MKKIPLNEISAKDHLLFPDELFEVGMHTSATRLMINFKKERPHVIDSNISAQEAQSAAKKMHVHLLIVADENMEFAGLVSTNEINEEAIIRRVAKGEKRKNITVEDLMIRRNAIKALDYNSIQNVTVGDIIHTLTQQGTKYCMVVDNNEHNICGMFSLDDLSRRLHTPITLQQSPSFAEIVEVIAHA